MANKKQTVMEINAVKTELMTFCLLGRTPFVCNTMSVKVQRDLLAGGRRKSKAELEATAKHNPIDEYRASMKKSRDGEYPTRALFPSTGLKRSMGTAALEMPGATKASLSRLLWTVGDNVPIYGVPQLFMAVVRMANINKTPDIRTRAIIPRWATMLTIEIVKPNMKKKTVTNLLHAAGLMVGIGDGRPEKGALTFGQFEIVADDHPEFLEIVKGGGVKEQDAALADPLCYDLETEELLAFWREEMKERGHEVAA